MARLTAQQAAEKQARNLGNSITQIQAGVEAVTVSPMERAAAQKQAWVAGIQKAAADGSWENGLRRVSLQQWKDAFLNKGLSRIAAGATASIPKLAAFYGEFFPFQDSIVAKVRSMPAVTLQDSINRMVTMVTETAKFKRSK